MDKLGVGFDVLKQYNPSIILVSLSSQGLTGPESTYRSFGPTLEQLSGMTLLTGYPGEPPDLKGIAYPDTLNGHMAVGLAAAALRHRMHTGDGTHLDISQRELATCSMGEIIMDYTMNGRLRQPMVNGHTSMAPHAAYPCAGEDRWITITVENDEQWKILCNIMDNPSLANDEKYRDGLSRWHNQEELNAIISGWTANYDPYELMNKLQENGIPAGAMLNAADVMSDPHLESRDFFELAEDPDAGSNRYFSRPWKFSKTPGTTQYPAPLFAQHNGLIYGELLGLTDHEISELDKNEVTSRVPTDIIRSSIS